MNFFSSAEKEISSSKGLGLKGRDLTSVLPASVGRFLFTRTDYRQAIELDPVGTMAIPDLFDEYDRCWQAYISGSDPDLSRAFELSQINQPPKKEPVFLPRFRDIANLAQLPNVDMWAFLEEMKKSKLTDEEKNIIAERLTYAFAWLSKYAPDEYRYQISVKKLRDARLSEAQWKFLNDLADIWQKAEDPEKLQSEIFQLAKTKKIDLKKAFEALYMAVLDKAAWAPCRLVAEKISEGYRFGAIDPNKSQSKGDASHTIHVIEKPEYFMIDPKFKKTYPSVSIGIALIKGVHITDSNTKLEEEKNTFLSSLKGLTNELLGSHPEIISYRKLYKEMGIDWHSRRPSPEALLRRVALGKGLYTVNTCVDAYNLVVMKNRISVGAFDAENVRSNGIPVCRRGRRDTLARRRKADNIYG